MNSPISFGTAFKALLPGLVASYLLCIAGDLLFGWTMYQAWAPLLPGFRWPLTFGGFSLGLLWLVVYAAYLPLVFVVPYNYLRRQEVKVEA
jgi:hypothetical protein